MKAVWMAAVILVVGSVAGAGETGIAMKITGLPALPKSLGQVRLVDLPKVVGKLAVPVKERWVVVGSPSPTAATDAPRPVQQPTFQAGNLIACF